MEKTKSELVILRTRHFEKTKMQLLRIELMISVTFDFDW